MSKSQIAFVESIQRLTDEMREVIAQLELPQELIEAESHLAQLRELVTVRFVERGRLVSSQKAVFHDDPNERAQIKNAMVALDDAERKVRKQEREVERLRDAHAATIAAALKPYRDAANVAAQCAAMILTETNAAAGRVHRKLPHALDYSPILQALVRDMTNAQYAATARHEGAVDRAIAKMTEGRGPLRFAGHDAAPTRGKMKVDNFGYGGARATEVPNVYQLDQGTGAVTPKKAAPPVAGGGSGSPIREAAQSAIQSGIAMLRGGSDPK